MKYMCEEIAACRAASPRFLYLASQSVGHVPPLNSGPDSKPTCQVSCHHTAAKKTSHHLWLQDVKQEKQKSWPFYCKPLWKQESKMQLHPCSSAYYIFFKAPQWRKSCPESKIILVSPQNSWKIWLSGTFKHIPVSIESLGMTRWTCTVRVK